MVTVSVSGSTVTYTAGTTLGSATVTVTASDDHPGGTAQQTFTVTVVNQPPEPVGTIPDDALPRRGSGSVNASAYFTDPDVDDRLTYSASSSNTSVVTVSVSGSTVTYTAGTTLGSATVTVTAEDPHEASATQTFTVEVVNPPPEPVGTIPDDALPRRGSGSVNASAYFTDPDVDDTLTYSARSSNTSVVTVSVSGSTVTYTAGTTLGSATVTVTASDGHSGGTAQQTFTVEVVNQPPRPVGTIPDDALPRHGSGSVNASAYFTDPDVDDTLIYSARSSNTSVVTVSVTGSTVTYTAGTTLGSATVTVTARDNPGASATQTFTVTVANHAPTADAGEDQRVNERTTATLDGSESSDPDGDSLTYLWDQLSGPTVTLSDSAVVRPTFTVPGVPRDTALAFRLTVSDGLLSDADTVTVTVNNGPTADAGDGQRVTGGTRVTLNGSSSSDPGGSIRGYAWLQLSGPSVTLSDSAAVRPTFTAPDVTRDTALTFRLTVTDNDGATDTDRVTVTVVPANEAPATVGTISDTTLAAGRSYTLNVPEYFSDPDGDALTYGASSSDGMAVSVSLADTVLTVTAVSGGAATLRVTATDPGGLSAAQTFRVTVPNRAPAVAMAIAARSLSAGDTVEVELSDHFRDPDGDSLTYTVVWTDSTVVTAAVDGSELELAALSGGSAEVTVTAADPGGLTVAQTFTVTVANRAPVVATAIGARSLSAGDTVEVELSGHFRDPDGDALTYTVVWTDSTVVTAAVDGSELELAALSGGSADVTVTAADPGGLSVADTFKVTVANRAPTVATAIAAQSLATGDTVEVELSDHFSDPDGDGLTYTVAWTDSTVVTAAVDGSELELAALSGGSAEVTVTAADPGGLSVADTFTVTVANRAPTAVGTIAAREITAGTADTLAVPRYFRDPDGQALTYTVATSDTLVATVATAADTLVVVTGVARGMATVTVTAADPGKLTAQQAFAVTVPNSAPVAEPGIGPREVEVGDTLVVDLDGHFRDRDGDRLTYTASVSDTLMREALPVTAKVSGSELRLAGLLRGEATVTVEAADGHGGTASQAFEVTVPNQAPAVGEIAALELHAGQADTVNAAAHFSDPDGDDLSYTAATSDTLVATVSVSDSLVVVEGVSPGEATVTVTAADGHEGTVEQTIAVTVPNRAPETVGAIADTTLAPDSTYTLAVPGRFRDPDGQALTYTVATSDTLVARAATAEDTLVAVTGVARGTATIDGDGGGPGRADRGPGLRCDGAEHGAGGGARDRAPRGRGGRHAGGGSGRPFPGPRRG